MTPETTEPAGFDQAIEVAVEAEIGEFVRRDGARLRRTPETDSELVANSTVMLVQRMGGTSVREIDRLIAELQTLRALLQEEGERAQRKLAEYAHLCQSATQSTKIIADSLKQLKPAQNDATLTARNSLPTLQRRTDPPPARSSLPALPHRTDSLSKAAPSNERRRRAWGWPRKQELAPQECQISYSQCYRPGQHAGPRWLQVALWRLAFAVRRHSSGNVPLGQFLTRTD